MAEGVLFNIAEKILISAGHQALKEVASYWGARGDLKKLADTLELIKARVRDAESRHEESGNTTIKEWLLRLRHVLYQADDLFDDVLTVDRQKQRMEGNRIINQLGLMFSRSGPLLFNRKMAHEIKRIRQELDAIKSDMAGLNLKEVHEPRPAMTRLMNERETTAFVRENDVIGREDDKNNIIDMLFDSQYAEECVSVIPIVGLGGLGKTTLAQLVLSDERVKKEFQIAKWACVPDVNNQKEVLGKICKAFTDQSYVDLSLDQLKSRISESINNKKYLLVLDDIWDNSHSRWLDLKVLLECGGRGSKIIVTTRSSEIAGHVGNPYNLGLLKKVESWRLFQSLAFRPGQEESNRNLTKIGEEIVKNCGNLPLALRMVGSLLYCKSEDEWEMFRNRQVLKAKLTEDGNVVPVLKLSYDYLEPALKQCFAYCSLFPEDYEFDKVELVRLWMAQGYVDPINEEEGDRCFLELLRRNFFQDVKEDVERSSMRCKMHDLAKQVAGFENMLVDKCGVLFNDRSLHISVVSGTLLSRDLQPLLAAVKMRSLLLHKEYTYSGSDDENKERLSVGLISRFQSLRSLSLRGLKIKVLPKSIGRLRHLRYLNLSGNSIEALPEDITRLENLQSLDLSQCELLRELPRCFTKLTCLRHLAIKGCSKITEMPSELEKMKSLRELSNFIVGELNGLDALGGLNLRGRLIIRCNIWRRDMLLEAQGMNLKAKQHLTSLSLDLGLSIEETYDDSLPSRADVEMCMKHLLLLPPNLRFLEVNGYRGGRFPVGMVADLHKLVEIQIEDCRSCRSLPLLSHLPLLKRLSLWGLGALEYIEDEQSMSGSNADREFFPSLEFLYLDYLKELKGWSRVEKKERLCFPRLSKIIIGDCPKMMSMPQLPRLVSLDADNIREKLLMNSILGWQQEAHDSPPLLIHCLYIRSISGLVSLPLDFCNVDTLKIFKCQELRELILGYPNSPKKLTISGCERLRNTSQGLQHLSVIEKLRIRDYEDLDVWDVEDNEEGESRVEENKIRGWQALKSLRDLKLMYISNLEMLPRGIAYLQTLQRLDVYELPNLRDMSEHIGQLCQLRELEIWECPKLACLPQSIRGLTSLRELKIIGCPLLEERCERPDGQDWPLIHHIPNVSVKVNYYY